MGKIKDYVVSALKLTDKMLASDGDTGATKNILVEDIFNGGIDTYWVNISQSSTSAPTVVDLGSYNFGTVVWTRDIAGTYTGTLAGAFPDDTKLSITLQSKSGFAYCTVGEPDTIRIFTKNESGVLTDGLLSNCTLKVQRIA